MKFTKEQCIEQFQAFVKASQKYGNGNESEYYESKIKFWRDEIQSISLQEQMNYRPICEQDKCSGIGALQYCCLTCGMNVCDVCKYYHLYNLNCPEGMMCHGTKQENAF